MCIFLFAIVAMAAILEKRPFSRLCYKFWNSTQKIIESSGILYLNQLSKSMPSEMYTGLNGRARTNMTV